MKHLSETKLLYSSALFGLICALAELSAGLNGSAAMRSDGIYDLIETVAALPYLLPHRKEHESRLVRGKAILMCAALGGNTISAAYTIPLGGSKPAEGTAGMEFCIALVSLVFYLLLRRRKSPSPALLAELAGLRADMFGCAGFGLAFMLADQLSETACAGFVPYLDPLLALFASAAALPGLLPLLIPHRPGTSDIMLRRKSTSRRNQ